MAVIGGFRSNLSITRKTDGNFGNVSAGVLISKSRIKENGGNVLHDLIFGSVFTLYVDNILATYSFRTTGK